MNRNLALDIISVNTIQTPLLKNLSKILKDYYPDPLTRRRVVKDIAHQFDMKPHVEYSLTNQVTLLLSKDERNLTKLRKYKDSPFPFLSNMELFSNSVGSWDEELQKYGIKSRSKTGLDVGNRIYLIKYSSVCGRGNRYLRNQYNRLHRYRETHQINKYWDLSWRLMLHSSTFRLSSLNSWQPRWYKELSLREISKLWSGLYSILTLETKTTTIQNVWIESPKGKYRQLGIPPKVWRLYLHMQNMFLSYIYSPHLDSSIYDGFMYNRGCKSWWETVLWGPLLDLYSFILEVDLSSGFPNLSLRSLEQALKFDGLIPLNLIQLLLLHLKSPLKESTLFPTFESYVENKLNKSWRLGNRSVHMGLGISPILFVITVKWVMSQVSLLRRDYGHFDFKGYADDFSFYFNLSWLYRFYQTSGYSLYTLFTHYLRGENSILTYLNQLPILKESGVKFCTQKSGYVRIFWIWIKPYKSLGLSLYTTLSVYKQIVYTILKKSVPLDLEGSTRGRGANPVKRTLATLSSREKLNYPSIDKIHTLNLSSLLLQYRPYFGLLMSKLYSPQAKKTNNYRLSCVPGSLLWTILKSGVNKTLPYSERLNLYNSGSKMNELILNLMHDENHPLLTNVPNLKRTLNYKWPSHNIQILKEELKDVLPLKDDAVKEVDDHFYKFSELNLSNEELLKYKREYEEYLLTHRAEAA